MDARWTKKRGETFYRYKKFTQICLKKKFITGYDTTDAAEHDSRRASELVNDNDPKCKTFWMDPGYVGTADGFIAKGFNPLICEHSYRNQPLTDEQMASNRKKSTVRSQVEHIFGFKERPMGGFVFRGVYSSALNQTGFPRFMRKTGLIQGTTIHIPRTVA